MRLLNLLLLSLCVLSAQEAPSDSSKSAAEPVADKRAYGVIANYKTVEPGATVVPMHAKDKFRLAAKDSFDWPSFFVAGALSGIGHAQKNPNSDFGQGLKGYGKRYGTSLTDQFAFNLLSEGIIPSIAHLDPRYYRLGTGHSGFRRAMYAASRVLVTKTDHGRTVVNIAGIGGNAITAAMGNLYYPGPNSWKTNGNRFAFYVGTDALGNVLREFWPDIAKKLKRH